MVGMNDYGRRAMVHWRRWLPARYATIQDPEGFFSMLGRQAESQVLDVAEQLEGPDLPDVGYPEKVGRLNMARMQAEELVLREVILLEPEKADTDDDQEDPNSMDLFVRLQNEAVREAANSGDVANDPNI
jgi:hypothetical protein